MGDFFSKLTDEETAAVVAGMRDVAVHGRPRGASWQKVRFLSALAKPSERATAKRHDQERVRDPHDR